MVDKLYYNYKNQPIGELRNGIYSKRVDPNKHYMRIYKGYGISDYTLDDLKENGCIEIRLDTGKDIYRISVEDFELHKIKADYDDPQTFCALKWFKSQKEEEKQKRLL